MRQFSIKKQFDNKLAPRGPQAEPEKNFAEGYPRRFFDKILFWLKTVSFGVILYADFEYDIYFAPKSTLDKRFKGVIVEETPGNGHSLIMRW
jgi:hypothetical protein